MKNITFGKPSITNKELSSVISVLKSTWLGTGPVTKKFENNFRKYKKTNYAISVNSCTSALYLSLKLLNIKKGDEVITTSLTFCSTVNSIIHAGATPVLVDIDKDTLNINYKEIQKKINRKTKAIIAVHFAGMPCDMDKILKITNQYKINLIEDCAHAIESKYKGKKIGNFGTTGCFSFYVNKNICTAEGGMIITKNKKFNDKLLSLRLHGMTKDAWKRYLPRNSIKDKSYYYDVTNPGYKMNLSDLQSSLGLVQLGRVQEMWLKRKELYKIYEEKLKNLPLNFQKTPKYKFKHAYHLFIIILDKNKTKKTRDELVQFLKKNKIGFGIHYRSISDLSFYKKKYKLNSKDFPESHNVGTNSITLPLYPDLKYNEINKICRCLRSFFKD